MLPGFSGGTGEFVSIAGIGVGERTADLTEDLSRGDGGCPGYPATPARSGHGPASVRPLGAVGHTTARPTAWAHAANRTSRRASPPGRSRTPWRCCRAPRPGADHG